MENGKIQADSGKSGETSRKGRVQLGLQRTLSTEKFQSIVIHYHIDEEIEWKRLSDREEKIFNWQTILTREFKQIHDRVLDELKLSHKKAYFVDHTEKDYRPEPGSENSVGDLGNLDDLDTL